MKRPNVAIDGLAASGKSTVARDLAGRTALVYLDTGLMYRAVALELSHRSLPDDPAEFEALAGEALRQLGLEVGPPLRPGEDCRMLVRGEDVTERLHRPEVSRLVSRVAAVSEVRRALVEQQRRFADQGGVVMVGRDIASVVLPDAHLKIFLVADLDERARRRHLDFVEKGSSIPLERVREDLAERDHLDMSRADSPLVCVEGAKTLDTTGKTPEEVLRTLQEWILEAEAQLK